MPLELSFTCLLPNGVHARPASALEELAREFSADVVLVNQRTRRTANAKSILSLVGADIRYGDPCLLTINGQDEARAMAALGALIKDFPRHDEALPAIVAPEGELRLPPVLLNAGATFRRGTAVVPGIVRGRIIRTGGFRVPEELPLSGVADVRTEQRLMEDALQQLIASYGQRALAAGKAIESGLLSAQRSFARDEEFRRRLLESVSTNNRTAAGAIADAEEHFTKVFLASDNVLLRERVLDIQDVCSLLLQRIYGSAAASRSVTLTEDSVVVADSLTPCQFLALDNRFLKGLVLAEAGTTSHTVILARSYGIPTLVGVEKVSDVRAGKELVVLDADLGVLVTDITDAAWRYYDLERERLEERQKVLHGFATKTATTQDGQCIEIAANIATVNEAGRAFAAGAEGVGLFRTEMLYLDRAAAPDEAEQFEAYSRVIQAAGGKPVIIRTMDVGGDKPLSYLKLPSEENPFLGYRAVRIYPEFADLFRAQIRALVRASASGPVKVMLPMVATVDEVRWAKKIIAEEQARCAAEAKAFDAAMPVGAMIEVPSAVFLLEELCRELDFFSIGSNDLLQYFLAVDRANPRVAVLYNPLQPAFLRLLKQIVDTAHARKKWVGLCGEMGGQLRCLPLLAGLGLDEISVSSPAIGGLKAELSRMTLPDCRRLLDSAMECATADEVAKRLDNFAPQNPESLIAPELIVVEADAATKEEAIKRAVDLLYIHGRTEQPRRVEEAVWQREATYTTGFGHGFAIPHCKSGAVRANSLVLVKLRKPVSWGSLDEQPVRVVILLAVRDIEGAGNEHMKVISVLARQVMHEEFRARLEQEPCNEEICRFFKDKMGC